VTLTAADLPGETLRPGTRDGVGASASAPTPAFTVTLAAGQNDMLLPMPRGMANQVIPDLLVYLTGNFAERDAATKLGQKTNPAESVPRLSWLLLEACERSISNTVMRMKKARGTVVATDPIGPHTKASQGLLRYLLERTRSSPEEEPVRRMLELFLSEYPTYGWNPVGIDALATLMVVRFADPGNNYGVQEKRGGGMGGPMMADALLSMLNLLDPNLASQ
jgi:hypothetical protein